MPTAHRAAPADPFAPLAEPIAVTVVAGGPLPATDGAVLRLAPPLHTHEPGAECPACAARSDLRAHLFDLLCTMRAGQQPWVAEVLVDARLLPEPERAADRLRPGPSDRPALRDRTVLSSFRLARILRG